MHHNFSFSILSLYIKLNLNNLHKINVKWHIYRERETSIMQTKQWNLPSMWDPHTHSQHLTANFIFKKFPFEFCFYCTWHVFTESLTGVCWLGHLAWIKHSKQMEGRMVGKKNNLCVGSVYTNTLCGSEIQHKGMMLVTLWGHPSLNSVH